MGRRSSHTSDELRELIIRETTALVEQEGYSSLSAREIARRIEYSPGTLYNVFENLDDLVITIEGRLLDRLIDALSESKPDASTSTARAIVLHTMHAYLTFAQQNRQLWRLLGEHRLSTNTQLPGWYQEKLKTIQTRIRDVLVGAVPLTISGERLAQAGHGLWVVVHGIAGLSTCSKLNVLPQALARDMLEDLVNTYIDGLIAKYA